MSKTPSKAMRGTCILDFMVDFKLVLKRKEKESNKSLEEANKEKRKKSPEKRKLNALARLIVLFREKTFGLQEAKIATPITERRRFLPPTQSVIPSKIIALQPFYFNHV